MPIVAHSSLPTFDRLRAHGVPVLDVDEAARQDIRALRIGLQGIETLSLRMERHTANADAVARWLVEHPRVAWVQYPGLVDSPYYELARKYTGGRASGLVSFGIEGDYDAGVKCYDALQMSSRLVNIGDTKSLAAHPASTTHRQLTEEEHVTAGVTRDMIRLSVGIEHIDDILSDLEQALDTVAT